MKNNKISIYINGEKKFVDNDSNLLEILTSFKIRTEYIAIEINKKIISKGNYKNTNIFEKDKIEIVQFIGGG